MFSCVKRNILQQNYNCKKFYSCWSNMVYWASSSDGAVTFIPTTFCLNNFFPIEFQFQAYFFYLTAYTINFKLELIKGILSLKRKHWIMNRTNVTWIKVIWRNVAAATWLLRCADKLMQLELGSSQSMAVPFSSKTRICSKYIQLLHPWGLYYKTFYRRNSRIFVIS